MKAIIRAMVLLLALLVAACGGMASPTDSAATPTLEPAATTEPTAEPAIAPTTETVATECPEPTSDTYLLRDPRHGYCLLYPTGHKVERPNPEETALVVGSLLNTLDPRVSILVTPGDSRSAAEVADQIVADYEGFEIARSEARVAGSPAIVLDGVPGQDLSRQVIFTHDGRVYRIMFSPVDPADTSAINALAGTILESFTFIPTSETVTAEDECIVPKDNEQRIVSEAFGYCLVVPADFTYEEAGETNANLFVGSIMGVEHPKLFIEVTDAAGRTAAAATDELVASFEGFEIPRTFGETLGYEPAERLDGVPGQDLGRVLLVVHGDRLYRLTFVPADPAQGAVYEEMEALFAKVVNTFRFLP